VICGNCGKAIHEECQGGWCKCPFHVRAVRRRVHRDERPSSRMYFTEWRRAVQAMYRRKGKGVSNMSA
jgi:hypothetical protein